MNKLILLLVLAAVAGVGFFLYRKYQKVKPTGKGFYIDVNGQTDYSKDENGRPLPVSSIVNPTPTTTESKGETKVIPLPTLSLSEATNLVEKLEFKTPLT